MPALDASQLLRQGLLEGVSVLVAGPEPVASLGAAVGEACAGLSARVQMCVADVADEALVDETVTAAVAETGGLDLLVVDGAGLFAHALTHGGTSHAALRMCLDATWNVTRAVVNHAFLPAGRSGRIVYLAPGGRGRLGRGRLGEDRLGEYADAVRAGLENLGRTLSIEWARHGITLVTIVPGEATAAGEVAALTAYLASPAGAYFSGCLLDLRGVER